MMTILCLVLGFHVLILIQVIPYTIVWAGKLTNTNDMYVFETISIGVNLFLLWILSLKWKYVKAKESSKVLNILLWLFVIIFSLNTIGNLFSETSFEAIVFTPITLISAIFCWRIVMEKADGN